MDLICFLKSKAYCDYQNGCFFVSCIKEDIFLSDIIRVPPVYLSLCSVERCVRIRMALANSNLPSSFVKNIKRSEIQYAPLNKISTK